MALIQLALFIDVTRFASQSVDVSNNGTNQGITSTLQLAPTTFSSPLPTSSTATVYSTSTSGGKARKSEVVLSLIIAVTAICGAAVLLGLLACIVRHRRARVSRSPQQVYAGILEGDSLDRPLSAVRPTWSQVAPPPEYEVGSRPLSFPPPRPRRLSLSIPTVRRPASVAVSPSRTSAKVLEAGWIPPRSAMSPPMLTPTLELVPLSPSPSPRMSLRNRLSVSSPTEDHAAQSPPPAYEDRRAKHPLHVVIPNPWDSS